MEKKRPIDKVIEVLAARGLKQNALAAALGVPDYTVTKWKGEGEGKPSPYQLLQAARWLGVPVDYFLDHQMTEIPPPAVTDDEWLVLRVFRALRDDAADPIDHEEAIRRLSHRPDIPGAARPTTIDKPGPKPKPKPKSRHPNRKAHR